jgi:hypothetical protein
MQAGRNPAKGFSLVGERIVNWQAGAVLVPLSVAAMIAGAQSSVPLT